MIKHTQNLMIVNLKDLIWKKYIEKKSNFPAIGSVNKFNLIIILLYLQTVKIKWKETY